jgi:hypothetical protein
MQSSAGDHWWPRSVAIAYNQHFVQDIGAFQVGLGAVLLLAGVWAPRTRSDGRATGCRRRSGRACSLHLICRELGGTPQVDIPLASGITMLLLAADGSA